MRLLSLIGAALLLAYRDERGQVGFFKDLFKGAKDGLDAIGKFLGSLIDTVVYIAAAFRSLINDAFRGIRDLVLLAYTSIVSALLLGLGKLGDLVVYIGGAIAGVLRDGIAGVKDLVTWFGAMLVNAMAAGFGKLGDLVVYIGGALAGVLRDGLDKIADLVKWFGILAANTVKESADRVADSLEDVAIATKDAATEGADHMADLLVSAFGFSHEFMGELVDLGERYMRGDLESVESMMAALREKQPQSSVFENVVYGLSYLTFFMTAVSEVGGVRAESIVQHFRRENPTALLDTEDIRDAVLRGIGNEANWIDELKRMGFADFKIDAMRQLWQELPPPSDLIRMAVREAFDDRFAALVGADQEFPADFAFNAARQGISEDWAQKYWRAHWSLPSAEQGFHMFHLGEISRDELNALLKALDYTPFWRTPLTNIAYNTVTRVDVRRLFAAGVWDRARVLREYLNIGNTPENAEALTQWTVTTYGEDTAGARDLTRTAIEQAYKQGRLTRDEATARIVELGYDEDEADFLLANVDVAIEAFTAAAAEAQVRDLTQSTMLRAYRDRIISRDELAALLTDLGYTSEGVELLIAVQDFDVENGLAELRAKVVEQHFKHGRIAGDEARAQLAGAGLNVDRADLIVQRWEAQFAEKTRELTAAELERALEKGVIDEAAYVDRLLALGYGEEDALIKLALTDVAAGAGARELSASSIAGAYKRAILSRDTTKERLVAIGFAADDAELQLRAVDADLARAEGQRQQREASAAAAAVRDLSQTTIARAWTRGIISESEAVARLVALGFREDDALLFLATQLPAAAPAS